MRPTNIGNALAKMDTHSGDVRVWHEPGGVVGEPRFVPAPHATAEDEGVVLAPGTGADGAAFVLVVDAGTWVELARVRLPYSTPFRFHGLWLCG